MQIQGKYGLFPRISGQGDKARRLVDSLQRMRKEIAAEDATNPLALTPSSIIENIIIIDREVDFVTPLLTQLTYEGLIDEVYGVENCMNIHKKPNSSVQSIVLTTGNSTCRARFQFNQRTQCGSKCVRDSWPTTAQETESLA